MTLLVYLCFLYSGRHEFTQYVLVKILGVKCLELHEASAGNALYAVVLARAAPGSTGHITEGKSKRRVSGTL
jgi:hypothetical protein